MPDDTTPMQTYPHGTLVIVLDCHDLERSATFWCEALGYQQPFPRSGPYLQLVPGTDRGTELLLQQVLDAKTSKNRMHLDLRTPDLTSEVTRLVEAGATQLTTAHLVEHDWQWHVLGDPDGNEFCVLQPPDDFPWPTSGVSGRYELGAAAPLRMDLESRRPSATPAAPRVLATLRAATPPAT
jgi:hypothetical protein